MPFLAIFIGIALVQLGSLLASKYGQTVKLAIAGAAAIPLVLVLGHASFDASDLRANGIDTRTLARNWILQNIPKGEYLLMERYAAQLPRGRYNIFVENEGQLVLDSNTGKRVVPLGVIGELGNIEQIHEQGIRYLVIGEVYLPYNTIVRFIPGYFTYNPTEFYGVAII